MNLQMTTALISHSDCALHEMGALHPEAPVRLDNARRSLEIAGLSQRMVHYEAPIASHEALERVHDPRHLKALTAAIPEHGYVPLDLETRLNPWTWRSVQRAAGANVLAVDLVMRGEVDNAFCCVRPPGHHAEAERPVGFCFVNNIAVGVAEALEHPEIERVVVADFDAHYANGTEDIFADDPRVMICSAFQELLIPLRMFSKHEDRIINTPLAAGAGSAAFQLAVTHRWIPAIERFDPDFVFISAGFDGHWLDAISGINLTETDFEWATTQLRRLADKHCKGRLVSSLEGGYHLTAFGSSVGAHVGVLLR